ncbi:polyprenyl synthetase family protein [Pseudomonadota bacterium]|nr:polyprenyl synthetase family protein [Pseudomonadota bacterium]
MPNLSKNLKKDLKKVESLMRKNLSKEPVVKDLYDYIFDKSGKKVRASISLISSYGMNKNQQNRVKLAAIIELLHTATLVHDDIIDNSDLRRGKTTVNVAWSNSHGVLIGDFIYSKAFMLMNEIGNFKVIDELSSATNKIAEGELMQLANKNNLNTSLQQLKKISYYKTGRLFEASAKSAAMLSGKSIPFIENISKAARLIGIAFQVRDDLLDYGVSKGNIGKPEMQDILEDKITYPLYFALKNSSKKDSSKILKKLKNKDFSIEEVADFVSSSNAFNKCNSLIQNYSNEISKCISQISNKEIRDEMLNLSESLKNRYE